MMRGGAVAASINLVEAERGRERQQLEETGLWFMYTIFEPGKGKYRYVAST